MTPNEYQQLALRTESVDKALDTLGMSGSYNRMRLIRLLHGAVGMNTEQAELADMLKKHLFYGKDLDLVNVLEEVGDALWYCAVALDAAGYTMEEAMLRNIAKLRARYPEKFDEGRALERNLDTERKILEGK